MDVLDLLPVLDLTEFVAFDFETTGLDADQDRIIEVSAVLFKGGKVEDSFSTLVNPEKGIPPHVTTITGIDDAMVAGAPTEKEVYPDLIRFLGVNPLVAHNVEFDLAFLDGLRRRRGEEVHSFENVTYDTLFLARAFLFFLNSHSLRSVGSFFGLDEGRGHRAFDDAVTAGKIFLRLVKEASSYPLSVIQRIVSILGPFELPTKKLFENLARHLVSRNLSDSPLVKSTIEKEFRSNVFDLKGSSNDLPESADHLFGEEGPLVRGSEGESDGDDSFEVRKDQIAYASFIDKVFSEKGIGITEAGTGLGKSLAYLYPALGHAKKNGHSTVISCYTKHLQDQLFFQEIPKLARALDIGFTATVLKGRRNYVCRTRLERVLENVGSMLARYEAQSLVSIVTWLSWTETGDLDECPGFLSRRSARLKSLIQSEPGYCTSTLCARNGGCFLGPIREASRNSHLVVVNHSLLLAELSNPGILPPVKRVVVDEAHNLASVAYDQFQVTIDHARIKHLLSSVDRDSAASRLLKRSMEETGKSHPSVKRSHDRVERATKAVVDSSVQFFQRLATDHVRDYDAGVRFDQRIRYRSFEDQFGSTKELVGDLIRAVKSGERMTEELVQNLNDLPETSVSDEVMATVERVLDAYSTTKSAIEATAVEQKEDWVYWETGRFRNGELTVSLNGVPIDVGEELGEIVFRPLDSVVVTSATLKVSDSFDYLSSRLGIERMEERNVLEETFSSPFNYEEQCRYFQWAGDVSPGSPGFPLLISQVIERVFTTWGKRTMILFTSWNALEKTYDEMVTRGVGREIDPLVQTPTSSRTSLLNALKGSRKGVLLGTRSFWEGVDLPNDLLEILVVTRLPFDVPNDPVVEAYGEKLAKQGGNPFLEYSVPEAAMKLRQGFGRLIRTTRDEGIFINMDNRVTKRRYGHFFQEAIPVPMTLFHDPSELF